MLSYTHLFCSVAIKRLYSSVLLGCLPQDTLREWGVQETSEREGGREGGKEGGRGEAVRVWRTEWGS